MNALKNLVAKVAARMPWRRSCPLSERPVPRR